MVHITKGQQLTSKADCRPFPIAVYPLADVGILVNSSFLVLSFIGVNSAKMRLLSEKETIAKGHVCLALYLIARDVASLNSCKGLPCKQQFYTTFK